MAENEEKLLFIVSLSFLKKSGEKNNYLTSLGLENLGKIFSRLDEYWAEEYEEDYLRYSKK